MTRAVLDASVLVSARINPHGTPGQIVDRFISDAFELVSTAEIFAELRRALGYRRVRSRLHVSDENLELWVRAIEALCTPVRPREVPPVVSSDRDDDIYIAAALEGRADYIVSGDRHLLDLVEHEGVQILTPRVFLGLIPRSGPAETDQD